jgi:hypothetical protein
MLATTFEGYGLGNILFGAGPDGRWEYPVAAERPYSYARTTYAPTGLNGFYKWTEGNDTYSLATANLIANVANITYTGGSANAIVAGDQVLITGLGEPFDTTGAGYVTVTGGNGSTFFTYADTAANFATANVVGNVIVINETTENPTYTAATANELFANNATSGTEYNVPGNINFNPDVTVDRVIASNEDPTV